MTIEAPVSWSLFGSVFGWSFATTSVVTLFANDTDPRVAADAANVLRGVFGGMGGFFGAMVIAFHRQKTTREVLMAILLGTMLGIFLPPVVSRWVKLQPEECGLIGLCIGLLVFGILQMFSKLSDRVGRDGDKIVNRLPYVRDIIPPEQPPVPTVPPVPSKPEEPKS